MRLLTSPQLRRTALAATIFMLATLASPAYAREVTVVPGDDIAKVFPSSGSVVWENRPGVVSGCTTPPAISRSPRITNLFFWDSAERMADLRDATTRAYEHEVTFDPYDGGDIVSVDAHNLPFFYVDTDYGDDAIDLYNVAAGSWQSRYLNPNKQYVFGLNLQQCGIPNLQTDMIIGAQKSRYQDNLACGVIGRAWCVYLLAGYPRDIVPKAAGYKTVTTGTRTHYWESNRLSSQSWDYTSPAWSAHGTSASIAIINDGSAYEGNRYGRLRCSSNASKCTARQLVWARSTQIDFWTLGTAIRCERPSGQCPVTIRLTNPAGDTMTTEVTVGPSWQYHEISARDWLRNITGNVRVEIINNDPTKDLNIDFSMLHQSDVTD